MRNSTGWMAIDYVDFVRYDSRDFVSSLDPLTRRPLRGEQLGPVVFHVRCSLSRLNDRTGKDAPEQRDGDAAFLIPGTPVYAVKGWPTSCRLAARHDGRLHLYLAYRNGGRTAAPLPCGRSQR